MSVPFKLQIHVHGFSIDNCRKTHFNSILKLFLLFAARIFNYHVDFTHVSSAQNSMYRLEVNEFAFFVNQ